MAPSAPKTTTDFGKITGKTESFIHNLTNSKELKSSKLQSITMTGTVKLDGAHMRVVIEKGDTIRFHSRHTKDLTLLKDFEGFAEFAEPWKPIFLLHRDDHFARFKELNPKDEINPDCPFILAGEWVGPGVQNDSNFAIGKISKNAFFIWAVQVNGYWLPDVPYRGIRFSDAFKSGTRNIPPIFRISRGGFFTQVISLKDPAPALQAMQQMADQVEAECPIAKILHVTGQGEGIVWKPQFPFCGQEKFWIKMKGPISNGTNIPGKQHGSKEEFVAAIITIGRMEQAWRYLAGKGLKQDRENKAVFLGWIKKDITDEEKTGLKAWKLNNAAGATFWRDQVDTIAARWYRRRQLFGAGAGVEWMK